MGLLGTSWDDPKTAATLQLVSGLLGNSNFGRGASQGLLGYSQALQQQKQQKQTEELRAMQMQQIQQQLATQKEAADQRAKDQSILRSTYTPITGPTQDGGPLMPRFDPRAMLGQGASPDAVMGALQMESALTPKRKLMNVAPGASVIDEGTGQQVFKAEDRPDPSPLARLLAERNALPPGHPMTSVYDEAIKKATTHQPATNVSVNTGQKGFDNTLKLRGDFRSEPIYKAHQEVQSAHAQITQALKLASPAGDLAGATKIMKILDPGSVVRESELGMAMAATGLLDRVQNYAQMVVTGQKLNPAQRADFQKLADRLFDESTKAYNAKRGEYKGIAERNGLSVPDVLGPEPAKPASSDGWSIKPR